MIVEWEVEDGYVGACRMQQTKVPDEELKACDDDEERMALINEYIEEDFLQKITWHTCGPIDLSKFNK